MLGPGRPTSHTRKTRIAWENTGGTGSGGTGQTFNSLPSPLQSQLISANGINLKRSDPFLYIISKHVYLNNPFIEY